LVQRQVRSRDVDAICSLRLHYEDGLQATRLTAVIEDTVYRCVQEAVNNALKHSGSPTVSLEVVEGDGWLHVAVRDAGRGFTVAAPARGFGLLGMRERLSLVGGTVAIDCPPRGGTTVAMYVPAEHRSV
jgi:two-component system sensor histidine kinase UhpB